MAAPARGEGAPLEELACPVHAEELPLQEEREKAAHADISSDRTRQTETITQLGFQWLRAIGIIAEFAREP